MKGLSAVIAIVLALVHGFVGFLNYGVGLKGSSENLYPLSTVVVEISDEDDTVICEDFNGNLWAFYGVEDWFEGDICALLMDSKGTPEIYDDVIVNARYCGYVE